MVIDQLLLVLWLVDEMILDEYHQLIPEKQKMVRAVAHLFFDGVKFQEGRKSKKLKKKPWEEIEVATPYEETLVGGLDRIWESWTTSGKKLCG